MPVKIFNASGNWTSPFTGVAMIAALAGSGAGATAGGGGGGGAYSAGPVNVTKDSVYFVVVGAGGADEGGDSNFPGDDVSVVATQGRFANLTNGGAGGLASDGTGATKFSGGDGGPFSVSTGGGGGGAASTIANGAVHSNAPSPGAGGGAGGLTGVAGSAAIAGGGGGGGTGAAGAVGSAGFVSITFYIPTTRTRSPRKWLVRNRGS